MEKNITERHVQAIWYDASLRPQCLVTRDGISVAVVSPGEWNLSAGPDFLGAVLEIGDERRRVTGDVEVHLCPSDWDLHKHGSDPNYRNVIAHVTWNDGLDPATLPPDSISIWLGRIVCRDRSFSPNQIDISAYPYARLPLSERPCEKVFGRDPDLARRVLADAGRRRLKMKAMRIAGRLAAPFGDRMQVFYEEVMVALGYSRNSSSFRHVAERVPISELPRDLAAARTAFAVAASFEQWDRCATRPSNSPERRLAAAAELFLATPMLQLADANDFSPDSCRDMVASLCRNHVIGRGRAAAVVANVIVPFAIAENRICEAPEWLPPEDVSAPVRLAAFRILGRDHNPSVYATNNVLVQGLFHVLRALCAPTHPDCLQCRLPSLAA